MRFISPHAGFRLIAVHQETEVLATGKSRVIGAGYTAEFNPWDATDAERELARETFTYTATVTDEGGRPIDPINGQHRIASFDTANIADPELRARVEKRMLSHPEYGRKYILVEQQKVEAPYAKYREHRKIQGRRTIEHVVADLQAAYASSGFDIDQAIQFERQENGPVDVIAALEALRVKEPEEDLVAA